MLHPTFVRALWERDVALLSAPQQPQARELLTFASESLRCPPHHRASKAHAHSDHQTIFKHPSTGLNCLVLSVVPDLDDKSIRVLRIDFFDKSKSLSVPFGVVCQAPRTQWARKGERRIYLNPTIPKQAIEKVLQTIIALK